MAGHLGKIDSWLPHLQLLKNERLQAQELLPAQIHAEPATVGHNVLQIQVGSVSAC